MKNIMEKQDSKYHYDSILHEFYYKPLERYIVQTKKKTRKELYEILSQLTNEPLEAETIKKRIEHKRIHGECLHGIQCLLILTGFYKQFFDIGMTHRREYFNSERRLTEQFQLLSMIVPKNDVYWGRWLDLYRLRYDSNSKYVDNDNQEQKSLFKDFLSKIDENYYESFYSEEIALLKEPVYSELIQLNKLKYRLSLLNLFFKICFYETYRSWLRNTYLYNEENKEKLRDLRDLMVEINDKNKKAIEKLDSLIKDDGQLYLDFRLVNLLNKGNSMIGNQAILFSKLDSKERTSQMGETEEAFAEIPKYDQKDTRLYYIWYQYYEYLLEQRRMEHALLKNDLAEGFEKSNKAMKILNALEDELKGGFYNLLLKVKYQKRGLYYIMNSIEAMMIEKETENPFGHEYRINDLGNLRNTSFENNQRMVEKLRKAMFSD